jgi:hypothetical protein
MALADPIEQRASRSPAGGPSSMPVCLAGDLRFVQDGRLGPDATSLTYRISGAAQIERTGPDGAYLIVGPGTPQLDRPHQGRLNATALQSVGS